MNKHLYVLALLGTSFLEMPMTSAGELRGQIADDSATFTAAPGENGEFKTPLEGLAGPSHMTQRDLKAMRDSAALPRGRTHRARFRGV